MITKKRKKIINFPKLRKTSINDTDKTIVYIFILKYKNSNYNFFQLLYYLNINFIRIHTVDLIFGT